MKIQFTTQIFKEGRTYVAHTPELDLSSCGATKEKALKNLKDGEDAGGGRCSERASGTPPPDRP
jgi:hypothetical protein